MEQIAGCLHYAVVNRYVFARAQSRSMRIDLHRNGGQSDAIGGYGQSVPILFLWWE